MVSHILLPIKVNIIKKKSFEYIVLFVMSHIWGGGDSVCVTKEEKGGGLKRS